MIEPAAVIMITAIMSASVPLVSFEHFFVLRALLRRENGLGLRDGIFE
jgi:hypothetical protein